MVATTAFSARSGWSISPGIRWSVSRGTGGQFPPESGGQYQRILHIDAELLQKYVNPTAYYYICGPDKFIEKMQEHLHGLGVESSQIVVEES